MSWKRKAVVLFGALCICLVILQPAAACMDGRAGYRCYDGNSGGSTPEEVAPSTPLTVTRMEFSEMREIKQQLVNNYYVAHRVYFFPALRHASNPEDWINAHIISGRDN